LNDVLLLTCPSAGWPTTSDTTRTTRDTTRDTTTDTTRTPENKCLCQIHQLSFVHFVYILNVNCVSLIVRKNVSPIGKTAPTADADDPDIELANTVGLQLKTRTHLVNGTTSWTETGINANETAARGVLFVWWKVERWMVRLNAWINGESVNGA
jgi:hypothetical protein